MASDKFPIIMVSKLRLLIKNLELIFKLVNLVDVLLNYFDDTVSSFLRDRKASGLGRGDQPVCRTGYLRHRFFTHRLIHRSDRLGQRAP